MMRNDFVLTVLQRLIQFEETGVDFQLTAQRRLIQFDHGVNFGRRLKLFVRQVSNQL